MINKFVFVHVPKSAGTSFHKVLANTFGKNNVVWDPHNVFRMHFTNPKKYVKHNIIYGHFTIEKYRHLNRPQITLMRDPIERTISEYFYALKIIKHGNEKDLPVSPHIDNFRNICDWVEYRPNMQYTIMKDVNNFDWIGFTEDFKSTLNSFEDWACVKLKSKSAYLRRNNMKSPISKKEREYVKQFNLLDIELYKEAQNKWRKDE